MTPATPAASPPCAWLPLSTESRVSPSSSTGTGCSGVAPTLSQTDSPGAPPTPAQPLGASDANDTTYETSYAVSGCSPSVTSRAM